MLQEIDTIQERHLQDITADMAWRAAHAVIKLAKPSQWRTEIVQWAKEFHNHFPEDMWSEPEMYMLSLDKFFKGKYMDMLAACKRDDVVLDESMEMTGGIRARVRNIMKEGAIPLLDCEIVEERSSTHRVIWLLDPLFEIAAVLPQPGDKPPVGFTFDSAYRKKRVDIFYSHASDLQDVTDAAAKILDQDFRVEIEITP